ncbi:unnamed protein product [Brachionus calyciflorus]|uniref:Uncharacterized protein n=1 Tax=Brachionus calyciflorus TaxID=104777 RepID=A0A813Q4D3_9BILA|nr:unnamed protein product [Brachionus calyciflorus]
MTTVYNATCGTCIAPAIIITPCPPNQTQPQGNLQPCIQFPQYSYQYPNQQFSQNFTQPSTTCFTNCITTCGPPPRQNCPPTNQALFCPPQNCLPPCPPPSIQSSCPPQLSQACVQICPPTYQQNCLPPCPTQCPPQPCIPQYYQNSQPNCITTYQQLCQPNCPPITNCSPNNEPVKEIVTVPFLPYSRQNRRGYPTWD